MERNFEGKQFIIKDPKRRYPNIDCMFFPSTEGDEIILDPEEHAQPRKKSIGANGSSNHSSRLDDMSMEDRHRYLQRSTIIMCNPNALIY